jgi:hypothetical protein
MDLLPFSDASGIRYRVSLRILDTSRMANLNTGSTDDTAIDPNGTYFSAVRLAPQSPWPTPNAYFRTTATATDSTGTLLPADSPARLQSSLPANSGLGRAGLSGTYANYSASAWEREVLRIEKPDDPAVAFFDLADELDLRSYGEFGTSYHIRAATAPVASSANYLIWPNTLSSNPINPNSMTPIGNPSRRNYTTYSFSREIRPYVDPVPTDIYTLTPSGKYVPEWDPATKHLKTGANATDDAPWPNPTGFTPTSTTSNPAPTTLIPIWPAMPLRINVNYPLGGNYGGTDPDPASANYRTNKQTQLDAMFRLAMVATNIATAMKDTTQNAILPVDAANAPPFSQEEIACFVANYCANRWNGLNKDSTVIDVYPAVPGDQNAGKPIEAWYYPSGPSFVDKLGICIRTADPGPDPSGTPPKPPTQLMRDFAKGDSATDPNSRDVTTKGTPIGEDKIYLGYVAQPFINEVAVFSHWVTNQANNTQKDVVVTDIAIELYNPYDKALSLNGYQLKNQKGDTINLSTHCVPANGYLIIASNGSTNFKAIDPPQKNSILLNVDLSQFITNATGGKVVLQRPWFPRQVPPAYPGALTSKLATVDEFDYTNLVSDAEGTTAGISMTVDASGTQIPENEDRKYSQQRPNNTIWAGTVPNTPQRIAEDTMGKINTPTGGGGTELYDRSASGGAPGGTFANPREFNRILRICTEIDPATGDPAPPNGLIAAQAAALNPATLPYSNTDCVTDSQIHFDFLAVPWNYSTNGPPAYNTPTATPRKPGDLRAVRLLEHLSFIDRVTDGAIDVGGSSIDKLRLPGQINVNTASGDVLRAIPNMTDQMVANIIGYRYRLKKADAQATYKNFFFNNVFPNADFDQASGYSGMGIRSLSELMVPINAAVTAPTSSLADRDAVWASIYNLCTVRSDTFVVYGFLEALKLNPAYDQSAKAFDNSGMWYGSKVSDGINPDTTVQVIESPNDPNRLTAPLLRVSKRRWVAIIDRSFCNADKKQPLYQPDGTKNDPITNNPAFSLPKIVAIKDLPQ